MVSQNTNLGSASGQSRDNNKFREEIKFFVSCFEILIFCGYAMEMLFEIQLNLLEITLCTRPRSKSSRPGHMAWR